jgi:hypothetical protein
MSNVNELLDTFFGKPGSSTFTDVTWTAGFSSSGEISLRFEWDGGKQHIEHRLPYKAAKQLRDTISGLLSVSKDTSVNPPATTPVKSP